MAKHDSNTRPELGGRAMTRKLWIGSLCLALAGGCTNTTEPSVAVEPSASGEASGAVEPGASEAGALGPAAFDCRCDNGFAPDLDPTHRPVDVDLDHVSACEAREPDCQRCFACFGWQLFVGLNWPAAAHGEPDPSQPFGQPGDHSPVVWETFVDARQLFATGQTPAWDDRKLDKTILRDLRGKLQADNYWLTDQGGKVVSYEIRINRALYDYIRDHGIATKAGLRALYDRGEGLELPAGEVGGEPGTIELKAAWREVPEGQAPWFEANYKVSEVEFVDEDGQTQTQLVALVGLHIAQKTPKLHQWAWATFEHVDNVPRPGTEPDPSTRYNFFNPALDPNYAPSWTSPPDEQGGTPPSRPVQVERAPDLDFGEQAELVNAYMSAQIASRDPSSVWRNYRLVEIQWPMTPTKLGARLRMPSPDGDPRPQTIANVTMETYMQQQDSGGGAGVAGPDGDRATAVPPEDRGKSSCIGCHRLFAITPPGFAAEGEPGWYTELSTIFYMAQ